MKDDLSQPISQGEYGADASQASSMEQIALLIGERSEADERESCQGSEDGGRLYREQAAAEQIAKEVGIWYSLDDVFRMGIPGPSGSESDTYVDRKGGIVYKTNNLIHSGSITALFRRLLAFNDLFPQAAYQLIGFTGYEGRTIMPLFKQCYIEDGRPATPIEIETYMAALGFHRVDDWAYENEKLRIYDLKPQNVLKDAEGDMYVIDAEIKFLM
ncbi:MAG: hypothetical protein I3J02_06495 [Prevotella sp.]|nr:hypothetical protein [Prevotella sp.]